MSEKVTCPNCEGEYIHIGQHWSKGSVCSEPEMPMYIKEILKGVLMGDGCLSFSERDKNPSMRIAMTNKEYLDFLKGEIKPFSTSVSLKKTAEESAKDNRKYGFRPKASCENYSDIYELRTRNLRQLSCFVDWYSETKQFPSDLELTPTSLKHWYVCDGHYSLKQDSKRGSIVISLNNESSNKQKIKSYFRKINIQFDNWRIYEGENKTNAAIVFNADKSEQLFEYMGEPLPGFKYKWPDV